MDALIRDTQKFRFPDHGFDAQKTIPNSQKIKSPRDLGIDSNAPTPLPKDSPLRTPSHSVQSSSTTNQYTPSDMNATGSYFNPFSLQRTNSIYSLSRVSFSSQISQLTSLQLPQASSLSSSITAIPTSQEAARALTLAADQIRRWITKASEVLSGLDADDDIEWAAAGGREGLGDVDSAIGRFEGLIRVYVGAIEELQSREDIASVPPDELRAVVNQMEGTITQWDGVRKLLKGVKEQVEMAMEWEELWNVVLGDIGSEMEEISRLVFEMEENRHNSVTAATEGSNGIDIGDLDTIDEENPGAGVRTRANHRFSLPPDFSAASPVQSPGPTTGHDDSNLLALFARMQPLRASLDFLPMRLDNFQMRAEAIFPTSCTELQERRVDLENKWKRLEGDADSLRRELGEDRWVLVFRNAGRQAQKLCESVDRSIKKLKEAIDSGAQHSNPPGLWKKVESYEAKKLHYGPAIQRVLAIIDKGVKDRLTVNGEIIRLDTNMNALWRSLELEMKELDYALEEIVANRNQSQQLRDSLSSIISNDRSATASGADTPGSSPASSVVTGPSASILKTDPSTPAATKSRPNSIAPSSNSRPNTNRRYFSMPPGSAGTSHIPRKSPGQRLSSGSNTTLTSRVASPSPGARSGQTPTNGSRIQRPSMTGSDSKPRWNSSVNTRDTVTGHNFKAAPLNTPSPRSKRSMNPSSTNLRTTYFKDGRTREASPASTVNSPSQPSSNRNSLQLRTSALPSPSARGISISPARSSLSMTDSARPRLAKRQSGLFESACADDDGAAEEAVVEDYLTELPEKNGQTMSLSAAKAAMRPKTMPATSRRLSQLPTKSGAGRASVAGNRETMPKDNKPRWR